MAGLLDTIRAVQELTEVSASRYVERELFSLGRISFHGFEAPQSLHILGRQITAVHEYIGGGRSVQVLGPQLDDIRWQGVFVPQSGSRNAQTGEISPDIFDPIQRALEVDLLRTNQEPIDLIFGALSWRVIVKEFDWDIAHANEISYSITVTPIRFLGINGPTSDALEKANVGWWIRVSLLLHRIDAIFEALRSSEIYLVLSATELAILREGEEAMAALGGLIITSALFPELGLIQKANLVLYYAGLFSVVADEIRGV